MEFRCSECGHIGAAASVRDREGGVELECAECGAHSDLDVGDDGDGSDDDERGTDWRADEVETSDAGPEEPTADGARETFDAPEAPGGGAFESGGGPSLELSRDEAVERLIPEEGPGLRCPKCAKLLRADADNCVRCGLSLDEARQYEDGEAPWQQPPPDREGAYEQAELLWRAFVEEGRSEKLESFVEIVHGERFYEMGIRKLRFYLVDHPEDEAALEALRELAMGVQSQIASAKAKAEVDADELNAEIKSFKRRLIYTVLLLWAVATVFFIYLFWG